jgi:hypothetical protein
MTVGKAQAGIPAAVSGYGNVLACVASIWGLSVQERSVEELDLNDPRFPLVACAHAEKPR